MTGSTSTGLNTAATLWCSAAVGVLSASGHLAFAAIGIATVLAVHVAGRPLGRLIDHDNPTEEDEDLQPYRLHITYKPKNETAIRATIVNNTARHRHHLARHRHHPHRRRTETKLTAHLLLAGDAATRLEQLVSRLSLEPGIHAVHWHTADDPGPLPVTAPAPVPAPDASGTTGQS